MMGQLHIVATIVRFEFTLTEFLKSHIHARATSSIQTDVSSLSIPIDFSYPSSPSLSFVLHYEFYTGIFVKYRRVFNLHNSFDIHIRSKSNFNDLSRASRNTDDNEDDRLREWSLTVLDSPLLLIPLWHERNSFIKSKKDSPFFEGGGGIWLMVDPGLGPRRFHVIVREGKRELGVVYFSSSYTRTHTHTTLKWSDDE